MGRSPLSWISVAVIATTAVVTLVAALMSNAPLNSQEAAIANQAQMLADRASTTALRLPLLFHAGGETWYQPLPVYAAATLLQIGVAPERAVRVAMAPFSASLLVFMPTYFFYARVGGGELMMVPPVLAWVLAVLFCVERPNSWMALAGGAVLGLSAYTQPAGVLTIPVYLALGSLILWRAGRAAQAILAAVIGVVLVILPFLVWFVLHPDSYLDTFGRWAVHPAHIRNPWEGLVAVSRWPVLARRVGAYWDYLSPTFLFASGQVFHLAMALLIPLGLWSVAGTNMTAPWRLIIIGSFIAPLAGVLLDVPRSAGLTLMFAPFGALLAAQGLLALVQAPRQSVRVGGFALLALLVLLPKLN
jgi:hypothetical protein